VQPEPWVLEEGGKEGGKEKMNSKGLEQTRKYTDQSLFIFKSLEVLH